jgi:predicted dehydrogenase
MRFLVVGLGSIGERYVRNLRSLGFTDIDVVRRQARPPRTIKESDFTTFTSLDEALDRRPAGVIVANPTSLHAATALAAARAGAHLLIEIPLASSLEQLDELTSVVAAHRLSVVMGHNLRFHPCLMTMKKMVDDGAVGQPIFARAEFGEFLPGCHPWEDYRTGYAARKDLGGGAILTSIHEIDFLQWILGDVTDVAAMTTRGGGLELDVEDTAAILMRHRNGSMSEVHLDFVQPVYSRACRIVGRDGAIEWRLRANTVEICRHGEPGFSPVFKLDTFDFNETYLDEIRHFVDCIQAKATSINDLAEGTRVLEVGMAALQSSATRSFISLPAAGRVQARAKAFS